MTAPAIARRVLTWAAEPSGPPPEGALWDIAKLALPDDAILAAVRELARSTAARLGAGTPPFADDSPIGAGTVLLAAAVGGRRQAEPARRLARAVPPSRPSRARPAGARWYDLIARHGLVMAALGGIPRQAPSDGLDAADDEPLTETLLRMSPLSAVLHRPAQQRLAAGTTGDDVEAAAALAVRPRGLAVLTTGLAAWSPEPTVLRWRVELLERLGRDYPDLVLDTYTLARLRHGADWDLRLGWAGRQLHAPGNPDPLALATVRFWAPLAAVERRQVRLPDRRPLLEGYQRALQLVRYFRLTTAGVS
ncbi:MAG TPA: hypothetical protein VMA73_12930 [Streptosporangiaceae bacterium]|nr:hypothetical protein [Streptosporangiaceae bacterium]